MRRRNAIAFAALLLATWSNAWAELAEGITAVMTVRPTDGERYAAVELILPEGQALSGLSWYNNDEATPFERLILMEAEESQPPDLMDSGLVLLEVEGPTLAYGVVSLEEAVSSSTGRAYAVFVYPVESDLTAAGYGGGAAVGIREDAHAARSFLSHGGQDWVLLEPTHELAVDATLVSGKSAARTLASLAAERGNAQEAKQELPVQSTLLHDPYPNPFNPRTTIRFDLKDSAHARVAIYNLRGQLVRELANSHLPSGRYERIWAGDDGAGRQVSSGLYFVRLEIGEDQQVKRVALVR